MVVFTGAMAARLKTPQEREQLRRSLHKSAASPAWKTAYRKRCKERLKANREKFLSRCRGLAAAQQSGSSAGADQVASSVQEVMVAEWAGLQSEHSSSLPSLPAVPHKRQASFPDFSSCKRANRGPPTDSDEEFLSAEESADIDYVLSIMDELTQELIREEQAILERYEQDLRFDEEALCAAIQCLSTNDVVCPLCQKNILHQNLQVIFCACGLRLDTEQDGITLEFVGKQLEQCSTQHSEVCRGTPVFALDSTLGIQSIIMNCSLCDYMFVIV